MSDKGQSVKFRTLLLAFPASRRVFSSLSTVRGSCRRPQTLGQGSNWRVFGLKKRPGSSHFPCPVLRQEDSGTGPASGTGSYPLEWTSNGFSSNLEGGTTRGGRSRQLNKRPHQVDVPPTRDGRWDNRLSFCVSSAPQSLHQYLAFRVLVEVAHPRPSSLGEPYMSCET